jgi:hypothetical protein
MAAPAYTWEFVQDLYGTRVPQVAVLEATASLETKVGTLLIGNSGQVDEAGASVDNIIGLAMEATSAAATAADPIQVALLAPGMVIKGTADADASALSGFAGKTQDLNADGSLDVADTSNGALSVYRTEDSGLTVYCTINATKFATS